MNLNKKTILLFLLFLMPKDTSSVAYKAKPLDTLQMSSETAKTLSFNYLIFNKSDCRKYLGRDKIISKGFQPIQIYLINNTERHLVLSLDTFSIPCISHDIVAQNVHFNTAARVLGWSIGTLFLWPLIIPAIIEGIESPRANENMDDDYARKSLINNQIIKPFSTVNGLVFVSADNFRNEFSLALIDSQTNERFALSTTNKINSLTRNKNQDLNEKLPA